MPFGFNIENFFNKDVTVTVQIGDPPSQRPICMKLNLNVNLSNIRKKLEEDNIINSTLSFSKKIPQNNDNSKDYGEILHEENFLLKDIVDESYILYLINNLKPDWQTLNNLRKLDYGCTMAFDGIKIAEKQAFMMNGCELNPIDTGGFKKESLKFKSKEDWMKKTNLFVKADGINVMNFVKLGLTARKSQNENFSDEINSAYNYTELGKVLLKFSKENLELTQDFKDDVDKAIKSKDPREEFKKIIKEYGQFIPTEVILGGRVYFKDVSILSESSKSNSREGSANAGIGASNIEIGYNSGDSKSHSKFYSFNHMRLLGGKRPNDEIFNEKAWIESLDDFQNWERIELQNPISIFQVLPDLRKRTFKSIGKRILYTNTEDHIYKLNKSGEPEIVYLTSVPPEISKILQNKEAECNIFAVVIDTEESKNDFFNCQILCPPNGKPGLIIHCVQKKFTKREYKLKIRIMIIGYDIDFNHILSDSKIQLEVLKNEFNASNNQKMLNTELLNFEHKKGPPCIGIPEINKSDSSNNSLVIGHHFFNAQGENKVGACTFSYCLKNNHYVYLPNFTIYTLIISNYPFHDNYGILSFERKNIISNLFNSKPTKPSLKPKYISLYSAGKNHCGPIFLKQKSEQIKIKYLNCLNCKKKDCFICMNKVKISEKNLECKFFDPYISENELTFSINGGGIERIC